MISFDNTEIAFKSKSNQKLNWAYLLFRMIDNNTIVRVISASSKVALRLHLPIGWVVKPTIYAHFVGGETLEECQKTVLELSQFNVKSILDYSVESTDTERGMELALAETLRAVKNADKSPHIPFSVFKPTAFVKTSVLEKASAQKELNDTEQKALFNFRQRVDSLCKTAYYADNPILIDAEDYCYQNIIDQVATEMMAKYNKKKTIVYNTFQMYRWDRLGFLKEEYQKAREGNYNIGAKFVRGAYMEKERERASKLAYNSPIQPNKEATDRDFNEALTFSVEHIDRISVFCGTHNEESCKHLIALMQTHKIGKNDPRIWFSQLYGMSDHISFNLAHAGYNVAKYIPYAPIKNVLPYLLRRMEENTSIAGQTGRELKLIIQEKVRRKKMRNHKIVDSSC